MANLREPKRPFSLLEKIGIGMVLGLVGPFVVPVLGGVLLPLEREYVRIVVLFGPVFGGAMAYFLHRGTGPDLPSLACVVGGVREPRGRMRD